MLEASKANTAVQNIGLGRYIHPQQRHIQNEMEQYRVLHLKRGGKSQGQGADAEGGEATVADLSRDGDGQEGQHGAGGQQAAGRQDRAFPGACVAQLPALLQRQRVAGRRGERKVRDVGWGVLKSARRMLPPKPYV